MDTSNSKKKKFWFSFAAVALVLLVIIIIFKDQFASFFGWFNAKLSVLNSLVIGAVIAYLLNPLEKSIFGLYKNVKNHKTRRFLSIFSTYFVVLGMATLFVMICVPQVIRSVNEIPLKLKEFVEICSEKITLWYDEFRLSDFYATITEMTGAEIDINEILTSFGNTFVNIDLLLKQVADYALVFIRNLYTGVSDTFIGLIFSIYLLASRDTLKAQARKITTAVCPPKHLNGVFDVVRYTDKTFGGFIQGKLVNAVIISVLTWLAFWLFDIPYPQLLAIIIGVTDIIPVFGPFIGAIPSAFIVLIAAPEKLIPMLLIIIIIQQVDGNYIGPKILGESTGLSALGVFTAIIVMGGYFGIIGMLIGVPTFAVAQYLITKAVDKKLVDRGEPTELDNYYNTTFEISHDENKRLFKKIVDPMIRAFRIMILAIIRFFKKLPKIRKKAPHTLKKAKLVKRSEIAKTNQDSQTDNTADQSDNQP